jgi:hypothetical protein
MHYHVTPEQWIATWQPTWAVTAALNTAYSIYWDTERDWAVPWIAHGHPLPRPDAKPRRLYGSTALYSAAVVSNAVLRVSWAYKLSPHLRHIRALSLAACLAEVVRRAQWCFFRVETELWAIADRQASLAHRAGS